MMASAWGATNAAPAPCANRDTTSISDTGESPAVSDVTPKTASPASSTRRWPARSPTRPPRSRSEPKVSAYPVTIHCKFAGAKCSSRLMVGSAMLTMLESSCSTNWAATTSPSAKPSPGAGGLPPSACEAGSAGSGRRR